jgi:hypothetical protein
MLYGSPLCSRHLQFPFPYVTVFATELVFSTVIINVFLTSLPTVFEMVVNLIPENTTGCPTVVLVPLHVGSCDTEPTQTTPAPLP